MIEWIEVPVEGENIHKLGFNKAIYPKLLLAIDGEQIVGSVMQDAVFSRQREDAWIAASFPTAWCAAAFRKPIGDFTSEAAAKDAVLIFIAQTLAAPDEPPPATPIQFIGGPKR